MAVWRTKASELFGFPPSAYSFSWGKTDLFADLAVAMAQAILDDNWSFAKKIAGYVEWACKQNSMELASAVDLAFFLPLFRNAQCADQLGEVFSRQLLDQKLQLLSAGLRDEPDDLQLE